MKRETEEGTKRGRMKEGKGANGLFIKEIEMLKRRFSA